MAARGVAKRYAQAVFDLASESKTQDQWLADLTTLANAASDEVAGEFFASPNVGEPGKRAAVDRLLPGANQQQARNLAYLLMQRQRFAILPDVLEVFRDLVLQAQGIAIADVTTAVELSPAEREQVRAQLAAIVGQQVELRARVDPSIIGGIVARIGDRLIDGSVVSQLRDLRISLAR